MGVCSSRQMGFDVKREFDNHENQSRYSSSGILEEESPVSTNQIIHGALKKIKRRDDSVLGKPFDDVKLHSTIGKELGRGQFGVTYLCTEKSSGAKYACKSIAKSKLRSKGDREDVMREVQIVQHLSGQPNILEFKGVYEDGRAAHVVMELCEGG